MEYLIKAYKENTGKDNCGEKQILQKLRLKSEQSLTHKCMSK